VSSSSGLHVLLEEGRRIRLDPANPRSPGYAQILDGIGRQQLLVYLELSDSTQTIERLLIPYITRVLAISGESEGVLTVELDYSQARHTLRADSPDFEALSRQLREALKSRSPVVVTEDEAHLIIDVRAFVPGPQSPLPSWLKDPIARPGATPDGLGQLFKRIWYWRRWPWWCWRCVSHRRAQLLFDALSASTCDPLAVPPPCIPFMYPDDGCWGRAHEMCRRMIAMGLSPQKVWIQGNLVTPTRNNPNCQVQWGWHVAPTLCVRGPRLYQTQSMVMDPALFQTPVSKPIWKGVQGDPSATLTDSAAAIFYLWGGTTDPTYAQTNTVLATYRLKLQLRSIQVGPPPYAYCP
jgi:Glutaminase